MPFKSVAQERFLYAKHPEVAKKFQADAGQPQNLPMHVMDAPTAQPATSSPWMHMGGHHMKPMPKAKGY